MEVDKKQVGGDHYISLGIAPWQIIDTWPIEQRIGYYRGNALKYLMRLGSKDDVLQEARKAMHYCEKLIDVLMSHNVLADRREHSERPTGAEG